MLTYAQIKGDRKSFLALTGLTHNEFKYLLPAFQQAYAQIYTTDKTLDGTPRQRQVGGGRKGALHAWEQKRNVSIGLRQLAAEFSVERPAAAAPAAAAAG